MAHGVQSVLKRTTTNATSSATTTNKVGDNNNNKTSGNKTGIGSRRIFPPHFKLQVLDSYRYDSDCKGNQRATARKYGIHRRQIQKWLQAEANLRNTVNNNNNNNTTTTNNNAPGEIILGGTPTPTGAAINVGGCDLDLSLSGCCRLRDDSAPDAYYQVNGAEQQSRVPYIGPDAYEPCCASPIQAAAALDYSSSSSNSSLCDMPMSSSTMSTLPQSPNSLTYAQSPSLSPSQYNKSPSPITITDQPPYHQDSLPFIHEPIDLSLKHHRAISPYAVTLPLAPLYINYHEDSRMADPEVWDLSIRKRPIKQELPEPPAKRPFKLFKPYLDDNQDPELVPAPSSTDITTVRNNYSAADFPSSCCPPSCSSAYYHQQSHYQIPYAGGYTCHQSYGTCPVMLVPLKQRQSYSVDFKLRAIQTYYYGDECCRGNQRAVASKYNVHRRQVQKWLRQEDELRTRNVSVDAAAIIGQFPLVR